ncbi:MAG TPA: flagellar motor switch protein FliM, partial [Acidobacteriaceae bacterium]
MTDSGKRTTQNDAEKQRNVVNCNFRSASRLSNENARALTSIHETYARHLASTLDAYLGTGIEVKLSGLEQLPIKEHIAGIPALTYIMPFSLNTTPGATIVECDISMVFPIVDLLLGGSGVAGNGQRELSEIEEEIMHDVVQLLVKQAESTWRLQDMPLKLNRRVKSSVLHQYCPPNEKVTCAKFEIDIAGNIGSFKLVFPAAFLNILLLKFKEDQPQKKSSMRFFPKPSIRERILDCDIE